MSDFKKYFQKSKDPALAAIEGEHLVQANSAMHRLFTAESEKELSENLTLEDMKGFLVKKTTDKSKALKLCAALEDKSSENFNADITFSIGEKVIFNVLVYPIMDEKNRIRGKIASFRDITGQVNLLEAYKEQSIKDFLTNTYNQRFFYNCLYREIKRFDRYSNPFCLLIVDVDHLKKINDKYGHLKGDMLLKDLAYILRTNTREGIDCVARYGGDEFAILLINTITSLAKEVASRIINSFNTLNMKESSLSIGICPYRQGMGANDMIEEADRAMYEAKQSGGDQVKLITA